MTSNRVTLIGYVGNHLSSIKLKDGGLRVSIRVATHDNPDNNSKCLQTVWHDVVAWNNTAVIAEKNFVKGSRILVEGSIRYNTYPDKIGHTRYKTYVNANLLLNLDR